MDESIRQHIRSLIARLDGGDGKLPVSELVQLTDRAPVDVTIDRTGDPTVVYATPRRDARFSLLSPREVDVAELMAGGLSNREIASRLYISIGTTKDHVHAVLAKTGCRSRAEVAAAWHGSLRT